jgi:thioredoxin-dependent peroxiredoxin
MSIAAGQAAPDFTLTGDEGEISLGGLRGRKVVLYFYPKDDTPGCIKEAIDFSQSKAAFDKADTVVIGVSKDSVASHGKFRKKHGLDVRLGADPEGSTVEAYGAWVEKSMYGRQYMGIDRATVLIDRDGKIARVWRKVKVPGHAAEVLAAAEALG